MTHVNLCCIISKWQRDMKLRLTIRARPRQAATGPQGFGGHRQGTGMADQTGHDMDSIFIGLGADGQRQWLNLKRANRHGLIAGATGTGKTVTLQTIAEQFSAAGVPGLRKMLSSVEEQAPLKRNVSIDDVGASAVYLLSDLEIVAL